MVAVTVVIPAYNAEETLADAVDSALAQTFEDFEIVVVDDGSSDGTRAIARSYGSPVRCVSKDNEGVSVARNVGIHAGTGEFVAFLDADDRWAPQKLERQVALVEATGAGAVYTEFSLINAEGRFIKHVTRRQYDDYCKALLLHSSIAGSPSSFLVSRNLLVEVGGFDPRFSQCADWDMWLRLSLRTKFAFVETPLVEYRLHEGNMSKCVPLLEKDTFAVLDKFYSQEDGVRYLPIRRRVYSNHWMILSGSYLHAGRGGDAVRCGCHSLLLSPANIRRPLGLPWRRFAPFGKAT